MYPACRPRTRWHGLQISCVLNADGLLSMPDMPNPKTWDSSYREGGPILELGDEQVRAIARPSKVRSLCPRTIRPSVRQTPRPFFRLLASLLLVAVTFVVYPNRQRCSDLSEQSAFACSLQQSVLPVTLQPAPPVSFRMVIKRSFCSKAAFKL